MLTVGRAGRVLRPLIALLLTAYVLYRANPGAVVRAGIDAELRWIAVACGLVLIDRALMAYRWIVLLCPIDAHRRPPLWSVLQVFFVSTFAGTFLPASIGGDIVRAYGLAQLRVDAGQALASVLIDRLTGVISILVVGAGGVALARGSDATTAQAALWSLGIGATGAAAAASIVFNARAAAAAEHLATRVPIASVRRIGSELTRATRAYADYRGALFTVLLGSILVQVLRIVQAWCLGLALGIDAGPGLYFSTVPMILLLMLLPITVNGLGTSQMAFVWFFGRGGVAEAPAFALSILFVALGIVGNLPGGLLYAFSPRRPT